MKKHTLLTKVMAGGLVTVTLLGVAFAAGQQGTQQGPLPGAQMVLQSQEGQGNQKNNKLPHICFLSFSYLSRMSLATSTSMRESTARPLMKAAKGSSPS